MMINIHNEFYVNIVIQLYHFNDEILITFTFHQLIKINIKIDKYYISHFMAFIAKDQTQMLENMLLEIL
jgi:vacuolar-type H+-ATPase subunit C/Vma6